METIEKTTGITTAIMVTAIRTRIATESKLKFSFFFLPEGFLYSTLEYSFYAAAKTLCTMNDFNVESVDREDDYYHARFEGPDNFETIRTPDWADNASDSVVEGSEVRMGQYEGSEEWSIQSVLIPVDKVDSEEEAEEEAVQIAEKIS